MYCDNVNLLSKEAFPSHCRHWIIITKKEKLNKKFRHVSVVSILWNLCRLKMRVANEYFLTVAPQLCLHMNLYVYSSGYHRRKLRLFIIHWFDRTSDKKIKDSLVSTPFVGYFVRNVHTNLFEFFIRNLSRFYWIEDFDIFSFSFFFCKNYLFFVIKKNVDLNKKL